MDRPIKILFLAANPKDTSQLRLDEEMRGIDQALRQSEFRDKFDIKQHWAVRVVDLQSYLLRHEPDIVHLSGHGSPSNEIMLEGIAGESQTVSSLALSQLFSVLKDNIRCVVLNACYSEQQALAIAKHIDCVIGMSKAIGDSAAVSFAVAFYQALGYGRDIKAAFDLGCVQINLESLNEQDTPKLLAFNSNPQEIVFARSKPKPKAEREAENSSKKIRRWGNLPVGRLIMSILFVLLLLLMVTPNFRRLVLPDHVPKQQRLAVLPFRAIGENPVNEALSQGLLYTVTNILTKEQFHDAVRVIPANEVLDEGITNTRTAANMFGVNIAISGSIERSGEFVRLTLNLVDVVSRMGLNSRTINVHPTNVLAFQEEVVEKLAELLEVKLSSESVQILQAGGTRVPGAYEFYLQGRGYLQEFTIEANIDAAISLFERAITKDTSYALAYAGLGEAYLRKYERTEDQAWINKAFQYGERAITIDNRLSPAYFVRGLYYNIRKRYEKAEVEFRQALELEPTNAAIYRGLATAYDGLNKLDLAEKTYKKAIDSQSAYWAGYNDLGIFYYIQGRHEEAIEQFRHVTELAPDNPVGYYNLGLQYYKMGHLDKAIPWYKKATEIKSDDLETTADASFSLGGIYYGQDNFVEAIRMYTNTLALKRDHIWGWQMLANANFHSGEKDNARTAWKHAISLAKERLKKIPSDTDALEILACAHAMLGERDQALAAIGRLLAQEHKEAELLQQIGIAYEVLGERDLALQYIAGALKHGLTPARIETEKWLRDLRNDPRYQKLISN